MATNSELRSALGRIGIWAFAGAAGGDPAAFGREVEQAGFKSVWFGGVNDAESLEYIEQVLAGTERLITGTGIASVWHWEPTDIAARADRLAAAHGGRFILGLGASHAPVVEPTGQAYQKPYSKTAEFVGALPKMSAPVVLAALGPRMLKLSAEKTAGAHPYFTPPAHTKSARETLGAGPLLIPEVAVALAPGADGLERARAYSQMYLQLPNYTNNLKNYGFDDADISNASERLMDAVVPHGEDAAIARIREHLDAGADSVLVQPLGAEGKFAPGDLGRLKSLLGDLLS